MDMKNGSARAASMVAAILMAVAGNAAFAAAPPVATYQFNGTLASSVAGAPSLLATDPLGLSGFTTDSVFGVNQQVYSFAGLASPLTSQAGLTLDTTGLLASNSTYSLELVFKFNDRASAWRRIVDVSSRTTDNGFYVDPSNNLSIYPIGGGAAFTNNAYHDVFLVNNGGVVTFYLDGSTQATFTTPIMNIDASNRINLFLDNLQGGGLSEYSNGSIASLRLYNEALSAVPDPLPPIPPIPPVTAVPEPHTHALLLAGLVVVAFAARRRRNRSVSSASPAPAA